MELNDIIRNPDCPPAFEGYLGSLRQEAVFPSNKESYYHAFEAFGEPIERFSGWPQAGEKPLKDEDRVMVLKDLVGAVAFLHARGLPHLCLNEGTLRVGREAPGSPLRLRVVGVGAGPSLNAANRTFQVPNSWAYTAPEVLSGLIVQSNLPALFAMDSWTVGTIMVMLIGG
eukprot:CAMPEP_0206021358 /NCGR_PEP_ID=MMETSP1464-20131121/32731_1 /ASSEMBLY_ACC=CAM_ASM_001124 /TAXON_ID=119497 /ORGANISM="Exanthemachrysis gayraliae, Strain RCC1523" /LENGTH=170 /DNA_ID=CAMNT_0053395301 /DNA_START=1 /DNA_END=509 /DNA_ORIENTATION=-